MDPSSPRPVTRALPVSFTGAPGAYSEEAARRYFGRQVPTLTCDTVADALTSIAEERSGSAIFPVENSVSGGYEGVVEALAAASGVQVVGEVDLAIRHCLLAAHGSRLASLQRVVSHRMALAHCRDWLANWGVETSEAPDTGRAAREIAEAGTPGVGVLGSRMLAEIYSLDILAEGLSDHAHNQTRFWVAEPESAEDPAATRTAVVVGPVDAPRALKTLRMQLEARGTSRTRAPFLCSGDARLHLVEFDHAPGEGARIAGEACADLPWRRLGSWRP